MARDVVALVSADDVVATVRVHADRLHDLLRRNSQPADTTFAVARSSAEALVTAIARSPETVGDTAGWWFGRAVSSLPVEPFAEPAAVLEPAGASRSVLAGTEVEVAVREAVARLPRLERTAVMLRDAYDLPLSAVAVALGRSEESTAALVATGRLRLMSEYDGTPAPSDEGHVGRQPIDLIGLAALADGSAGTATGLTLRRHLEACPTCERLHAGMSRARRLLLGLPVLAMPDTDREILIDQIATLAASRLPSQAEVLAAAAADTAHRGVPVLFMGGCLILAAVLGGGVGVLSRHAEAGSDATVTAPLPLPPLPSTPTPTLVTTGATSSTTPVRSRSSLPPIIIRTSRSAPTSISSTPTEDEFSSSAPATQPTISITPSSGPSGTSITVTGTGFDPDSNISITYANSPSGSTSTDTSGDFTATISANAALPGTYQIEAGDGFNTGSATFRQTT